MTTSELDTIKAQVLDKHRSLEKPDFHFRWDVINHRPYTRLIDELLTHFFIKDVTDLNQDGSFVYLIEQDRDRQWKLQISMVGPYAVLFRLAQPLPTLIDESVLKGSDTEIVILRILLKHHVQLLDEPTLIERFPLKLDYADDQNVRLYQVLFTDTDSLPWQRHS